MTFQIKFCDWARIAPFLAASLSLAAGPILFAQITTEAPRIVGRSVDHGPASPLEESNVTVHLKLHNEDGFNQAVADLYAPGSATYHQWMTKSDFARYAPTDAEIESVKKELASHGLTILDVDDNQFSLRVRGTTENLERAFQTQIHQVEYQGQTIRANVTPARLTGSAGDLVDGITGLTGYRLKPQFKRALNPKTGEPLPGVRAKENITPSDLAGSFTKDCFGATENEYLTTSGAALPVGLYTGNSYVPGTFLECGWNPVQIQDHYGLGAAYTKGIDGTGQTIVVIDGPTNSDYTSDLTIFSLATSLPAITSSNFKVIYPDGAPTPFADQYYDNTPETQIDIEWSHAIAPKAKIDLLITPTNDWDEFEYAIQYVVSHKLGNVISNSYGLPEAIFGAYTVKGFEQVLKIAAAAGIAVNFSSGDQGDEGTGTPKGGGDLYPAASPYVTSVGGTSIGIPTKTGHIEVGWGNNLTVLSEAQDAILDPPTTMGLNGGSGGGESALFAKPVWQSKLPGTGRQQPDISAIADPNTGAIVSIGGAFYSVGGTSLAAPVFSGIWSLANQAAGKSLGQVAPMLPRLLDDIHDIVPYSSPTNVTGAIIDSQGSFSYGPSDLILPFYSTTEFYSALWDIHDGEGTFIDISFGTDSSLAVTPGWDNVTGYGVPKGYAFIQAAAALK